MKLALNLLMSAAMLALCTWLVWPDAKTRLELGLAIERLQWDTFRPYLLGYLGLNAVMHFCRAWRWNNLLAPLRVRLSPGPLLAISSVGFLAILALPARLGEFVRPSLIRMRARISASAALGTVAVERVVDGLMVSVFVFAAFFALRGPAAPGWMMPTAYAALAAFSAALVFLVFALRKPAATVTFCLRMSLLPRMAPRLASRLESKLHELIRGFAALHDLRNMLGFTAWSLCYWGANGLSLWLLAQPFVQLSLFGAFGTMGLVAVGITLPNSPGLVGQFQWFTLLGLSLYLGPDVLRAGTPMHVQALAFALLHHGLQVIWYVAIGAVGLATPWVSLAEIVEVRKVASKDQTDDAPA
jgi:glycosyltransferase 2 family protein